jgi:hypothetical protein
LACPTSLLRRSEKLDLSREPALEEGLMGILKKSGIDYYSRFVMAQGYAVPGGTVAGCVRFPTAEAVGSLILRPRRKAGVSWRLVKANYLLLMANGQLPMAASS